VQTLPARSLADQGFGPIEDSDREYDLFLSHASEDKEYARLLVAALEAKGVRVWFDEAVLRVGDSLRRSIDAGLTQSRFGAVLFSHSFFRKEWPQRELDGMVALEVRGRKVVLPIWHPDFGAEDLERFSPTLADRLALRASSKSVEQIADALADLILAPEEVKAV
jgi:hypothetical protein